MKIKKNFNFTELVVIVSIVMIIVVFLFMSLFHYNRDQRRTARHFSCASNLKQIGTAMMMYSLEHDDKLPNATAPGATTYPKEKFIKDYQIENKNYFRRKILAGTAAGNFELLRLEGILKDSKVYKCPLTNDNIASFDKALDSDSCSYAYAYGMIVGTDSINGMPDSGLVADGINTDSDKIIKGNHEDFGFVLFLDASVRGFKGPKWYQRSGMWNKKAPTRILQSTNEMFDDKTQPSESKNNK